jgi:DNA-binding transcriptional MerR regulator
MSSVRRLLTIGEAAGLLGVTPKAIRHYHKVGLLPEPGRSENGYRLYGAEALLRLERIRRLSELGLSLKQVRSVLGDPGDERPLREVLGMLLGEVEAEIGRLEARRRRISVLLAGEGLEPTPHSPTFEMFKERLEEHLPPEMSAGVWEQEERLWATLDAYDWPEGYRETWEAVAGYYADHPEEYRQMTALGERIAALADEPDMAPEIERLARDLARFFAENSGLPGASGGPAWAEGPLGRAMSGLMMAQLSPAQARCLELVNALLEGDKRGGTNGETGA